LQRMQAQSSLKQQARLQGVSKTVIQRIMLSVGGSAGSASIQERRSSSLIPGVFLKIKNKKAHPGTRALLDA
jgi:hypothetical protein